MTDIFPQKMKCVFRILLFFYASNCFSIPETISHTPPRFQALIEEAGSVEKHAVFPSDFRLAVAIYCEAARFGSAEGHYRAGLVLLNGPVSIRDEISAKSFFYNAHELGHQGVEHYLQRLSKTPINQPSCLTQPEAYKSFARFNFSAYVQRLPKSRREIADMISKLAPLYDIPPELAIAVAAVESNFNPLAESPKKARGVMQLIPATAERFGVRDIWSAEDNIRGGLRYLQKLMQMFPGKPEWVIAAYNAGEGSVIKYRGIPPYYETQSYVFRVMSYANLRRAPKTESD